MVMLLGILFHIVVLSLVLFPNVSIPLFIFGGNSTKFISISLLVLIQLKKPFAQTNCILDFNCPTFPYVVLPIKAFIASDEILIVLFTLCASFENRYCTNSIFS